MYCVVNPVRNLHTFLTYPLKKPKAGSLENDGRPLTSAGLSYGVNASRFLPAPPPRRYGAGARFFFCFLLLLSTFYVLFSSFQYDTESTAFPLSSSKRIVSLLSFQSSVSRPRKTRHSLR